MTPSRTIASWRLGHEPSPLKHSDGQRVPGALAGAAEADDDRPAALLVELHVGAVAGEDLTGPARRSDEARAAIEQRQDLGLGRLGAGTDVGGVDPGVVVGVGGVEAADVEPSVVGGTGSVVGVVGVGRPAGVAGGRAVVVVDARGRRGAEPSPAVGRGPAGVVEPVGVDVVDGAASSAARHCSTGCSVTMPATSAASSASRWSRTPGQVHDDVGALDAHIGLGDPAVLELGAHEVTDDDEVVLRRALGRREDDGHAALQVESEDRRVAEGRG